MSSSWINLPHAWKLQNVQAVLNVIITALSALGIFACARFCWQSSVSRIVRKQSVPLASLLSISTFGDAVEALMLLKERAFQRRHLKILFQSFLVICLSVTGLVAGPIARFSTQVGHRVIPQQTPGLITWRRHNSILNAPVVWNQTYTSLEQAHFPNDQFLDYIPDTSIPWVYNPNEWNSSWGLDCKHIDLTPIDLEVVDNCTSVVYEIPGLQEVVSLNKFELVYNVSFDWGSYYEEGITKDALLAISGSKITGTDDDSGVAYEMNIDVAMVHMHDLPYNSDPQSACSFGPGRIGSARYTKIECIATRNARSPLLQNIAYPDSKTTDLVAWALVSNYQGQFIRESVRKLPVTIPSPGELRRFLQVWVATKDTQDGFPVTREIGVLVPVVRLSTAFLAFALLTFSIIVLALGAYGIASFLHRGTFEQTPQSKLDWMLKVVQTSSPDYSVRTHDPRFRQPSETPTSTNPEKRSSTSRIKEVAASLRGDQGRRRADFENARYTTAGSVLDGSSSGIFPAAQPTPTAYVPSPMSWQMPAMPFPPTPGRPAGPAYSSISEATTWRGEPEGERLYTRDP